MTPENLRRIRDNTTLGWPPEMLAEARDAYEAQLRAVYAADDARAKEGYHG